MSKQSYQPAHDNKKEGQPALKKKLFLFCGLSLMGLGIIMAFSGFSAVTNTLVVVGMISAFAGIRMGSQPPNKILSAELIQKLHDRPEVKLDINQDYIAWGKKEAPLWIIYWKDLETVRSENGLLMLTDKKNETVAVMPKMLSKHDKQLLKSMLELYRPQYKLHIQKSQ